MIRVCLHGAESTGKSTLARKLAERFACPVVPEYGRAYAETHGIDFTMADLLAIAAEQDRLMREAAVGAPPLLLLDTDLSIGSFGEHADGEVYVADIVSGSLYRLAAVAD